MTGTPRRRFQLWHLAHLDTRKVGLLSPKFYRLVALHPMIRDHTLSILAAQNLRLLLAAAYNVAAAAAAAAAWWYVNPVNDEVRRTHHTSPGTKNHLTHKHRSRPVSFPVFFNLSLAHTSTIRHKSSSMPYGLTATSVEAALVSCKSGSAFRPKQHGSMKRYSQPSC